MSVLYLVSTPIGNLNDMTLRAIETLKTVDVIACEDTRHSIVLLNHYNIKKPLISYHEHNEKVRSEGIIKLLEEGKSVALITDAGSPCVSDPGAVIVTLAREKGYDIKVIPGASAIISAVSLAGISTGFVYLGFLPEKKKSRDELIYKYKNIDIPLILYVSPHNINDDGKFLLEALGNRRVMIVKELTKMFESLVETTLEEFNVDNPRGEYVLIVMPCEEEDSMNSLTIREHVEELLNTMTKKEAIKEVAKARGLSKNIIYQEVLDIKE